MARRARNAKGDLLEDAFSAQVEGLATHYGWLAYHTHDSRRSPAGFPDWTFVRGPELIFAELKPERAKRRAGVTDVEVAGRPEWLRHVDLTAAQAAWLEALAVVGRAVELELDEVRAHFRRGTGSAPAEPPGVDVYVWRPSDFDFIHARLARGQPRHEPLA